MNLKKATSRLIFILVIFFIGVSIHYLANLLPAPSQLNYKVYKIKSSNLLALQANFSSCYFSSDQVNEVFSTKVILRPNIKTQTPADFSGILDEQSSAIKINSGAGLPIYIVTKAHIDRLAAWGDPAGYFVLKPEGTADGVVYNIQAFRANNTIITPPAGADYLQFKPCPPATTGYPYAG